MKKIIEKNDLEKVNGGVNNNSPQGVEFCFKDKEDNPLVTVRVNSIENLDIVCEENDNSVHMDLGPQVGDLCL